MKKFLTVAVVFGFLLCLGIAYVGAQTGYPYYDRLQIKRLDTPSGGYGVTTTDAYISDDLTVADDMTIGGNITRSANSLMYLNSDYQPETQYVAFDTEEAVMDADDGTGIKIESLNLPFNCRITQALVCITQGCGDAGDTAELIINDTDNVTSAVTTLDAAQDCAAAGLLAYTPAGSATVEIATMTATNQYLVVIYKDVGDDGGTSANLQGYLYVTYERW